MLAVRSQRLTFMCDKYKVHDNCHYYVRHRQVPHIATNTTVSFILLNVRTTEMKSIMQHMKIHMLRSIYLKSLTYNFLIRSII